jgi:hypothetical protein
VGECDERLWTQAEPGESETTHRKAIAWDVLPFGVRLKGRLARRGSRGGRLFGDGSGGRPQDEQGEEADDEAYHDEQDEQHQTRAGHEPVVSRWRQARDPRKRSSPASFKRLLGGSVGRITNLSRPRPHVVACLYASLRGTRKRNAAPRCRTSGLPELQWSSNTPGTAPPRFYDA